MTRKAEPYGDGRRTASSQSSRRTWPSTPLRTHSPDAASSGKLNMGPSPHQNVLVACTTSEAMDANDACFLCDQEPETIDHIVISCSFSKHEWWNVLVALGHTQGLPNYNTIFDWWTSWRSTWTSTNRSGVDSGFALVAWELWKERNARCFRGTAT
jgi:hypothetical protein